MSKIDIFALKEYAFAADLRNRNIPANQIVDEPVTARTSVVKGIDVCLIKDCDSRLVVGDGYRCRQCVLEGKY